ncbi:CoA-disulfide reductase [Virgibacillus sediminis]|uniref:CoA-disulfide reductase n=1 Tax=Virgibacillus sediminis TaxID=202260 RepID=A0ABV7A9A2_9BACI
MAQRILVVGGVGGGATVSAQIRRNDKDVEIIIFDKGEHVAFSNCGMPYYLGGVIENKEDILVPVDKFREKYAVDVRTGTEVTSIHRSEKKVLVKDKSGEYEESYDKLIISPGASAVVPDVEGRDEACVFTLRTIPDMEEIHQFIERNQPKNAAIIGGGFIGLEMAENLHERGITCTVIDRSSQVMKVVDKDMAEVIHEHLREKGIKLILDDGLAGYSNNGKTVHLSSGDTLQADMTLMATGVKPNTGLAEAASLKLGRSGAIAVNEYMQTNDPDIYALGDAVETKDFFTGEPRHVALAWPAHRQAYLIASHLAGEQVNNHGIIGTSIFKLFDLTIGSTGHNKETLKDAGIPYKEASLETYSHAKYYPGSEKLWLKILFDADKGTIYGCDVIGLDGADKRLGVLATAIRGKLTVADLEELELGYAPPYSAPKDPINILGYKANQQM